MTSSSASRADSVQITRRVRAATCGATRHRLAREEWCGQFPRRAHHGRPPARHRGGTAHHRACNHPGDGLEARAPCRLRHHTPLGTHPQEYEPTAANSLVVDTTHLSESHDHQQRPSTTGDNARMVGSGSGSGGRWARPCCRGSGGFERSRRPRESRRVRYAGLSGSLGPEPITSSRTNAIRASRANYTAKWDQRGRSEKMEKSNLLFDFFPTFHFSTYPGPAVFERDRAVEHQRAGRRVGIDAEVTLPLELKAPSASRLGQRAARPCIRSARSSESGVEIRQADRARRSPDPPTGTAGRRAAPRRPRRARPTPNGSCP